MESLLIVRLSAMGDVIHALPAAQALRDAFPQAMIGWLIEERWAELLSAPGTPRRGPRSPQRPLVDWVHSVNLRAWRKSLLAVHTVQQIAQVWNDVRSVHYDVAVDLQGAIRSAVLARWSGARVVYGAAEPRESPASIWYTRQTVADGAHVIEHALSVAATVAGAERNVPRAELPRDRETERQIDQRLSAAGVGGFAILNPGAGWGAKRWPAERYGCVAKALADNGVRAIINYGPGEESLARETEAASEGTAKSMKCSLTELIALTRRAKLFVGGDTGPMHLAAALCVPVVAIFGPTDPARNGPYGTRSIVLRNPASPTTHARNSQPDQPMLEIGVDTVVDAARSLLAGKNGGQECPPHREGAHG
ncbi:Lipopolysaccharide heptosyltransferase I [Candidatus Sulfotelmatobacter kueseliae]|uniref:Lipopolysaccharide heptosyltransferase I n=1 Tax=Candidatus Sulfotelmatobacter kueseliae TaxID=2042962 RepID=A0A2U3KJ80_9BACT|nr:Lipopolysaccharide heptosyltransferase I [Candidatus Sulfotelmatobacter kueseliae]